MNPFNQRAIDPAWLRRCGEAAERTAKELGCLVVQISVQEAGKIVICTGGENQTSGPETNEVKQLLDNNRATFFMSLAILAMMEDHHDMQETRQ